MSGKITFTESGMRFGPFSREFCFHVEKSGIYKKLQSHCRTVECLLIKETSVHPMLYAIEAKETAPKPLNAKDFDEFVKTVCRKFVDSLSLALSMVLKRYPDHESEFPGSFRRLEVAKIQPKLVLVIKNHAAAWLPPLNEALNRELSSFQRFWGILPPAAIVLNKDMAIEKGLVAL